MADSTGASRRLTVPVALVIVGAALLALALFLPWYGGEASPPIECLRAPCPQVIRSFNGWQAFPAAAAVLSALAVLQVVVSVARPQGRAAPVLVCLVAVGCVAVIAFALLHPSQLRVVTSLGVGLPIALFGCGMSGLGGLLAEIERRADG